MLLLRGGSARQYSLKRLEGRPCRALSFRPYGLPRVWSPLQGYAPWALEGSPLWGAYSPSRSQQSKEYNLQHKGPRASHPPPKYCASIHGHCGIPPKMLQSVLPRHRSSTHEYCGISSRGTAVCAPKGAWYVPPGHCCSSNGIVVFPPKVLRSEYPRVRGCTLPKVAQFHPRRYSMRLQEVPGVAACRVEPL